MDIVIVLLPIAIALGALFAGLFVAAVRAGQFDDLDDPPQRMLRDTEALSRNVSWVPPTQKK